MNNISQQYQHLYETLIKAHSFDLCQKTCITWLRQKGYPKGMGLLKEDRLLNQIQKACWVVKILANLQTVKQELERKDENAAWQHLQFMMEYLDCPIKPKIKRKIAPFLIATPNNPGFQFKDFPKAIEHLIYIFTYHWSQRLVTALPELIACCEKAANPPQSFIIQEGDTVIVDGSAKNAPVTTIGNRDVVRLSSAFNKESNFNWCQERIKTVILRNVFIEDGKDVADFCKLIEAQYKIDASDVTINMGHVDAITQRFQQLIDPWSRLPEGSRINVPVSEGSDKLRQACIKLGFETT